MKLSVLAASTLAGSALALPSASKKPKQTCMEKGQKASEWEVKNLDFHASYIFTTPAHQNSAGYVSFELHNPVLDYAAKCSATSTQLSDFFYGVQTYECDVPEAHAGDAASFTFNRANGELTLEQSWACVEEGGRFTAKGGKKIALDCKEEKNENPDWQIGEIYSSRTVTCKKVDAEVPIKELSAVL